MTKKQSAPDIQKALKAAFKSGEFYQHMTEVICVDDKCNPEDKSLADLCHEAKYVLSKYKGGSFSHVEDLEGENGEEAQIEAQKNVKALEAFLKKYDK